MKATSHSEKKVIIVDDDVDLLKILVASFEASGFKTHTIQDGKSALDYLSHENNMRDVSLLILDRMLPDADGLDILKKIPLRLKSQMPILILSILSDEHDIMEGLSEGAVDYIPKPFSLPILMEKAINLIETYKNNHKSLKA